MVATNRAGLNERSLPDGWEWTILTNIAISQSGVGFPKAYQGVTDGEYPFVKVSDISNAVANHGGRISSAVNHLSSSGAKKLHAKEFPAGTTLFAKIGEAVHLNRRALASLPVLADNNVMGLIPKESVVLAKFLYYFMHTIDLYEYSQATTVPSVRKSDVELIPVPLPPLPVQARIVSRIDELFSDLDAGVAALERVRLGLKRYKASVLKSAVEGELLDGTSPIGKGRLPQGWRWAKVSDIAEVRLGRQRSPARAQGPNMRKYMRAANVTWGGIDLTDVKEMDFSPKEQETYRLQYGDILLSEASGSVSEVGKPAVWKNQLAESYLQNTLIRIRPYEDSSEYLYYHFLYDAIAERFRKIAKGVGIHHLGAENLSNWVISLPPQEEQRRIVSEVERRLSVVREIEQAVDVGLARAARLRQAVLKTAFEGKLS